MCYVDAEGLFKVTDSHVHCKSDTITETVQDYTPLTGSDIWPIEYRHFRGDFSYSFAAVNKISADIERRAVPLLQMSLLYSLLTMFSI